MQVSGLVAWLGHDHRHTLWLTESQRSAIDALRMQIARAAFAGSALCGHTELQLNIVERRTRLSHLCDGTVGDALADANDHDVIVT